jgi:hypothetical protein
MWYRKATLWSRLLYDSEVFLFSQSAIKENSSTRSNCLFYNALKTTKAIATATVLQQDGALSHFVGRCDML